MSLAISFAVLAAALMHAGWNAMLKGSSDVLLKTAAIVAAAGLLLLPFVFIVPLPATASWPYLLASIVTHVAYYFFMISAYRIGDLTLAYPVMRGVAPLITAVLGIVFLEEVPAAAGWIGIAAISGGVIVLSWRPGVAASGQHQGRAIGFALANAGVIAGYTIIDGIGARAAGNAWSYIVWLFVLDGIPFTLWILGTRRRPFLAFLAAQPWRSLFAGALSAGAYAISVWAMTRAPVALVAALRETSVLFAALLGVRVLRERLTAQRWAGIAAVLAGVVAMKIA
jgi:drug/metabolite transporter (DMT)-like permease